MKNKPILLKIGGSVITKKNKIRVPNTQAIKRLAKEISRARVSSIIIVHGGGSYGHPIAKNFNLSTGYLSESQLIGFSKTHEAMISLNRLVTNALIKQGIPAFGLSPSSFIITKQGRIKEFEKENLIMSLKIGLIPVLHGDIVFDYDQGFTILSGDQLVSTLAVQMEAKKLIVGVDVDGLCAADPKIEPSAPLLSNFKMGDLQKFKSNIGKAQVTDVTGGMLGKIQELILPVQHEIPTLLINALKPNNVYKALKGEEVIGTKIT